MESLKRGVNVSVGEYDDIFGGERGDWDVSKGGCWSNVEGGALPSDHSDLLYCIIF